MKNAVFNVRLHSPPGPARGSRDAGAPGVRLQAPLHRSIPGILGLIGTLGLALLLGGCASFDTNVEHGRSFAGIQRFFVVSNLNDNHALDRHIAAALKARSREAGVGPLTMMPDDAQAVVTYQDHWTWDFGDHLTFLKITVRDARATQPFASITFVARVPLRESAAETTDRMVGELLKK